MADKNVTIVMESVTDEWNKALDRVIKTFKPTKAYTEPKGTPTPSRREAEGRTPTTTPPKYVLDELLANAPKHRRSSKVNRRRAKNRIASKSRVKNRKSK